MRFLLLIFILFQFSTFSLAEIQSAGIRPRHERILIKKINIPERHKRMPASYIKDINVVLEDDYIYFSFTNDNYKNINISVYYESSILYTNTFDHPTGTDISIQLPDEMEIGEYSVVIDNEKFDLIGYFVIEAE